MIAALLFAMQAFVQGETLQFDLTWLAIGGGSMTMTIAPQPGDAAHYRITSLAASSKSFGRIYSVRDEMTSIVDRDDFSTVRYEKHLREGGKVKDEVTTIDEARHVATRQRPGKITENDAVPKPLFDPLSLVYHLRDLDLTPGVTHRFSVYADGKLYTLEAKVTGRERLSVPAGTFNTVVVQPKMLAGGIFRDENATMTIWYSDDAAHVPVRIRSELKFGSITATLRSVRAGTAAKP